MRASVEVEAPIEQVWEEISDLASHVEWMADARRIRFLSHHREGLGTRMLVDTGVGPLRTSDLIEVTAWAPPERIEVDHRGAVSGRGVFLLEVIDRHRTRVSWIEDLRFPWYLGGRTGQVLAGPILRRIWEGNLDRFRRRVERDRH